MSEQVIFLQYTHNTSRLESFPSEDGIFPWMLFSLRFLQMPQETSYEVRMANLQNMCFFSKEKRATIKDGNAVCKSLNLAMVDRRRAYIYINFTQQISVYAIYAKLT